VSAGAIPGAGPIADDRVEVIVAGAGPAGIAAAVGLARRRPDLADAGQIVCFDKAHFPREKPCGGGLTGHARTALDALGLAVRVPAVACRVGRIVYGSATRRVELERPVDVVRRQDFDADLVRQARDRGIRIFAGEGISAHQVARHRRLIAVATSAGRRLTARVLVAADGAGSRIRKHLLEGDRHQPARPLRLFKLELPAPRNFDAEMIYDFSPMERGLRGYVWLFPVAGGRLNVGVMHTPGRHPSSVDIPELLERTLAAHGVTLPAAARGWPAWPYAPRGRLAAPHLLCVGDAAGIDALTGEGIAVGLEHGPLAAQAIDQALQQDDFSFSGYGRAVRKATVGRELALDGHLARRLYGRHGYRFWLSLVMFDRRIRELYASRVCGSAVLADKTPTLMAALARHTVTAPLRIRRLTRSLSDAA
jgi:flavin-dependent dehydrogenase